MFFIISVFYWLLPAENSTNIVPVITNKIKIDNPILFCLLFHNFKFYLLIQYFS
jgi:hypothetical protein